MQRDEPQSCVVDLASDREPTALTDEAARPVEDRALVGCFYVAGAAALAALLYVGFYAFAVADFWYEWGLLEPYLDERTGEILSVLYWPLIQLFEYLDLI